MKPDVMRWMMVIAVIGLTAAVGHGSTHNYYRGKTVRIVVGLAAGGGYDLYSRAVARHIHKHIPGSPNIIVENMPGAGSLISANYVYKVARPDGLTIGNFAGSLFQGQTLGQKGIEFDAQRFEYMGAVAKVETACAFTRVSGITSLDRWMNATVPPKMGATGPGTAGHDTSRILNATLGLPMQLVVGYKGTADIRVAVEGGELGGICTGWESLKSTWRRALDQGDLVLLLQNMPKAHPDLPKIPLAISYAKTEEARQLIQLGIHDVSAINRPYILPPGTPKDRVQALRKAFTDTMKDPDFRAEAERANMDLSPLTGEELESIVLGLFKASPALIAKLKQIILPK